MSIGAARVLACSAKSDPSMSKLNMKRTATRNNATTIGGTARHPTSISQLSDSIVAMPYQQLSWIISIYIHALTPVPKKKKPCVARTLIHVHGHGMQRDSSR